MKRPAGKTPCGDLKKEQNSDYCEIYKVLKKWYKGGKRTFVVTMSGAALGIKDDFKEWAADQRKTDQPVLVATIASAPGIAELDNGIFRHYIRSQDESDVFATFIESLPPLSGSGDRPVFVLYVDDKYGDAANEDIEERFSETEGIKTIPVAIPVSKQPFRRDNTDPCANGPTVACIEQITEENVFSRLSLNRGRDKEDAVVIIIGYGAIIKRLLDALHGGFWESPKFKAKILVVSTFTEEDWRPKPIILDQIGSQLFTVAPKSPKENRSPFTRGVVFQWSYLTLDRALREECKNARQPEEFWRCWSDTENDADHLGMKSPDVHDADWADVEFTSDGDSRIKLRLLRCEQWNTELKPGESCKTQTGG